MKVRIKFSKQGPVKFVGHLDTMRYFQKAMRRAEIAIRYSEGFNPHQVMSFASPLGLGLTSNGEYMDIEVDSMENEEDLVTRLNAVMAEGITILECRLLTDEAKSAMSVVAAADYTLSFYPGKEQADMVGFFDGLKHFYSQERIMATKRTKRGEKEVDLKPLIYELCKKEDYTIFLKLSAGSQDNLKPELVMDAYDQWRGEKRLPVTFRIQREEIYGSLGDGPAALLLPLGRIGTADGGKAVE